MSKIHVLNGGGGSYQLIIHTNTPVGVNSVANSWKSVVVAAAVASTSSMIVGTGIGQISSSEAASIIAGDVLEFKAALGENSDGTTPTSTQLGNFANVVIASKLTDLQVSLKFYGYTQ